MAADRRRDAPRGRVTDERPVVVLDTNALMMPVECDVPTFGELERLLGAIDAVVPRAVVAELDRLAESSGTERAAARVGRELAEECREIGDAIDGADAEILRLAEDGTADYVVTNDTPLRDRVLDAGIPVISLRGRTKLAVIRP